MHLRRFAQLWILLLVAAGLLLAPVAPAFARMGPEAAMQATSADIQAMSEDMPCCPDQTRSKTCDHCPFIALCMLSVPLSAPVASASLIERYPLRSQFAAHDDRRPDGLGAKPPDHPPRTDV